MEEQNCPKACQQELAHLREAHKKLLAEHKKQGRVLESLRGQIQRSRESLAAKDNLSKIVTAKRSQLERYMNLLLDNCPDIILLFDRDMRIVYCTQSFLRRCRLATFGMIAGKRFGELLADYVTPQFMELWEIAHHQAFSRKEAIEFGDAIDFQQCGYPRNYSVQVTPMLGENNTVEGSIVFFYDTTDIVAAQKEAERANAAKSDFLATVSHEIRTPLNAIIGVLNMLKDTGLTEPQLEFVNTIHSSSNVLLGLINDVLDLAKIEADKLELVKGYFDLGSFLANLRSMFEFLFEQKKLRFVCNFAENLPKVVFGDEIRVSQILTNLLSNALKYTQAGQVTFSAGIKEDGAIYFEVEDTGMGIKDAAIPKLFLAFEQFDLIKNKNIAGTGLGLAITNRLCELMQGEIQVHSRYGEGSCFSVWLPLPAGREEDLPTSQKQDEPARFTAPAARALLVDDIEINLQVAAYMLEAFGIGADLAHSGREAIEQARANTYDIIFMDQMMPEIDGIEATRIIRGLGPPAGEVPVIALTANVVNNAKNIFLENGFNGILPKPITETALAECLLTHLPPKKILREESQ